MKQSPCVVDRLINTKPSSNDPQHHRISSNYSRFTKTPDEIEVTPFIVAAEEVGTHTSKKKTGKENRKPNKKSKLIKKPVLEESEEHVKVS